MEQGRTLSCDGGYERGYASSACFWGVEPGSYVRKLAEFRKGIRGRDVLDAGCGEGKNAAWLTDRGASVTAVEMSGKAVENGRKVFPQAIRWVIGDVSKVMFRPHSFDIVVMYGLLHCLASEGQIFHTVSVLKEVTRAGGLHVLCAFNDGPHRLEGAHEGFRPTLLSHEKYLRLYADAEVLASSAEPIVEAHPDTRIVHNHSISRILARIA